MVELAFKWEYHGNSFKEIEGVSGLCNKMFRKLCNIHCFFIKSQRMSTMDIFFEQLAIDF